MRALRGVRPVDALLVVLLAAAGSALMLMAITTDGGTVEGARIDSHSWLLLPVWLVAPAAVLWWRRGAVEACLVALGAIAVHDVAFGWGVRCGAGLPLAFVLAF